MVDPTNRKVLKSDTFCCHFRSFIGEKSKKGKVFATEQRPNERFQRIRCTQYVQTLQYATSLLCRNWYESPCFSDSVSTKQQRLKMKTRLRFHHASSSPKNGPSRREIPIEQSPYAIEIGNFKVIFDKIEDRCAILDLDVSQRYIQDICTAK